MWLLSAACDAFVATQATGRVTPLTQDEIVSWQAVRDELLPRLWQHLREREPCMSGVNIDSSDAELRFHLRWQPQVTLKHSPALPVGSAAGRRRPAQRLHVDPALGPVS
jgi:hypothetical protein